MILSFSDSQSSRISVPTDPFVVRIFSFDFTSCFKCTGEFDLQQVGAVVAQIFSDVHVMRNEHVVTL